MSKETTWGVGSDQYNKRPGVSTPVATTPGAKEPWSSSREGTTGRVTWDRSQLDFSLIPESSTDRALFRFERMMPELVWNAAALEGNTYTLPEVQTLLDGVTVGGHKLDEADQIIALSDGMNAMVDMVKSGEFDLSKSSTNRVHALVARHEAIESGWFRGEGSVAGGGAVRLAGGGAVDGDPIDDDQLQLVRDYENLNVALSAIEDPRERALAYFCSATRSQFYFDGNKRTSRIMMSGELMAHGYEAVNVPYARNLEFNESLDILFRTDDATSLMEFLITCATGA